jgi:hypothetical protein
MKRFGLIAALLLAASPVAAQSPQQPLGAGGQTNTSLIPNAGVICIEEMIATFCNVPSSRTTGDAANAVLAAAGYNHLLLRWLELLLSRFLAAQKAAAALQWV